MQYEFKEQGSRIKAWRESVGLSEKDICDKFGWRLAHYRKYESGRCEIDWPTANSLAELFNTSGYYVMNYSPGHTIKTYKSRELKPKVLPSQEDLRALFDYDPEAGAFSYKQADFSFFRSGRSFDLHHKKVGQRADKPYAFGYRSLLVNGKVFPAHRMAIVYCDGIFDVSLEVDHLNGVRDDNRRSNIRLVTSAQNARNVPQGRNKTGFLGVNKMESRFGAYKASCESDGIVYSMGPFKTAELASAKLEELKEKMNLGFGPMHKTRGA